MNRFFEMANDYLKLADFSNHVVFLLTDYLNTKNKNTEIVSLCESISNLINANLNWSPKLFTSIGPSSFMSDPEALLLFQNAVTFVAPDLNNKSSSKKFLEKISKDVIIVKDSLKLTISVENAIRRLMIFFDIIGDISLLEARNLRESSNILSTSNEY
jgi:hypothetical protein